MAKINPENLFGINRIVEKFGVSGDINKNFIIVLIIKITNYILGFLGILGIIVVIYGGFIWMFSGGNSEKVDKAKKTIGTGMIGLLIILLSYILVNGILLMIGKIFYAK